MEQDLKQLQKQEAIERLKILQDKFELMETVTKEFEKEDTLYYSEYVNKNFPAVLYWINNNEEYEEAIKQVEINHNILVYHVILTPTYDNGIVLTLLYVSSSQEEWKNDREELRQGLPVAYVLNIESKQGSEFGGIQIAGAMGGIIRIA